MQVKHFISTSFQRFRDEQEGLTLNKGVYTVHTLYNSIPTPPSHGWENGETSHKSWCFWLWEKFKLKKNIYIIYPWIKCTWTPSTLPIFNTCLSSVKILLIHQQQSFSTREYVLMSCVNDNSLTYQPGPPLTSGSRGQIIFKPPRTTL